MTTATTPLGDPTSVDIGAIEHELNELWRQANADQPDAVARVCVANLLVMTPAERAGSVTETIVQLTAAYPNRAIVVTAAPDSPSNTIEAWVQANCQLPAPGRAQVCCEQITIAANGTAVARLPGTLLPLLAPDVPVVLWWLEGALFGDALFQRLADLADRVIVDAATFADPVAGLVDLMTILGGKPGISDMAWGRLTPWREAIAQFFDTPATAAHLQSLEHVVIEFQSTAGDLSQRFEALLMAGWLASRLKWHVEQPGAPDGDAWRAHLRRSDGALVTLELRPVAGSWPSQLTSVTLQCTNGAFAVRLLDAPRRAVLHWETATLEPGNRTVRLEQPEAAELLAQELRLMGRDLGYEEALRAVAELSQE